MSWFKIQIKKHQRFLKFAVVGATCAALDFTMLNIFHLQFGWNVYWSIAGAFLISATSSFLWNRSWTFYSPDLEKSATEQYVLFFIISAVGLLINLGVSAFLIEVFGLWFNFAKLAAVVLVALWNYNANKNWTFSQIVGKINFNKTK